MNGLVSLLIGAILMAGLLFGIDRFFIRRYQYAWRLGEPIYAYATGSLRNARKGDAAIVGIALDENFNLVRGKVSDILQFIGGGRRRMKFEHMGELFSRMMSGVSVVAASYSLIRLFLDGGNEAFVFVVLFLGFAGAFWHMAKRYRLKKR